MARRKRQADRTPEEQERIRAQWRERQRRRRRKRERIEVFFEDDEFRRIEREAERHGVAPAAWVAQAALAYSDERFLLPSDRLVQLCEIGIRQIGGDVHKLAKDARAAGTVERVEVEALYRHLGALEDLITTTLRTPPDLVAEVGRRLGTSPELRAELERILKQHSEE